jgi:CAAX prenyl protease-like protein
LSPFLVILATGMIAGAATAAGGVEWLYPLRFFAALGMLWVFRRSYASLNWGCDWLAPAIGATVFLMWVGLDRFSNPTPDRDISAALMASSMPARLTWITFRVLAAVVTLPLAEELAFRGYFMRRLLSRDFESVSFRRFSWFALMVSSAAFGLLHGGYWIAGSAAGILFGLAVIRRGRIGDAVVAHATANALLAAYVLAYHKWRLW